MCDDACFMTADKKHSEGLFCTSYSFTSVVGYCCSEVSESIEGGHKTSKEGLKDDSCSM